MTQAEPFSIKVPDTLLATLAARLRDTVWPDDPDNEDWRYGVNRACLRRLVEYWRDEFDWRKAEARINALPNYRTEVDGVPIHFVHRKGVGQKPVPIVITHGWPWTFLDICGIIEPLADPAAHGGRAEDAFDVIVPSLPGHGFSGAPPRAGINFWRTADLWHTLMTRVLGYPRYAASGGDWGALVSSQLGHKYAGSLYGIHIMHPMQLDQFNTDRPWDATARSWDQRQPVPAWMLKFVSHYAVQVLDPQTLAYALADSPVGTLAWLLERWRNWGESHGDPERVFSREHMITSAMIYWMTGTIGSSLRAYADAARYPWQASHARTPPVEAPTAITFLGGENPPGVTTAQRAALFQSGPRAAAFNTVYLNAHEKGGHFGYYENPQAVIHDLRAMFRERRG